MMCSFCGRSVRLKMSRLTVLNSSIQFSTRNTPSVLPLIYSGTTSARASSEKPACSRRTFCNQPWMAWPSPKIFNMSSLLSGFGGMLVRS